MDSIQLYKNISLEIVEAIKKDNIELLNTLLDKRQEILDNEYTNKQLIEKLIEEGIVDIDKEIQNLLYERIDKVKNEIKLHKKSMQVNNSYMNINKEKINIFYKKV